MLESVKLWIFVYHNKSKVILVISQYFVIIDLLHNNKLLLLILIPILDLLQKLPWAEVY